MKTFLIFLILGLGACQTNAISGADNSDREKAVPIKPKTHKSKTSESKSCAIDDDCKGFLRCIAKKCDVPPAITGDKTATTPIATLSMSENKTVKIHLELAVTNREMTRGLMHRKSMKDDWGMLFIYDDVRERRFWMKNTLIPLDMLFIDQKGIVVGIIEGAEPMTLTSRSVGKPAKYVLELNAGRAQKLGIQTGARMTLENVEAWQDIEK